MTVKGTGLQRAALEAGRLLPWVGEGYPFTEGLLVAKVAGHVFLIVTEDRHEQIITVKSEAPQEDALEREHPSAQLGHYLDKHHWVPIGPGKSITRDLIDNLVRDPYGLVVDGLPHHDRDRLTPPAGNRSNGGS